MPSNAPAAPTQAAAWTAVAGSLWHWCALGTAAGPPVSMHHGRFFSPRSSWRTVASYTNCPLGSGQRRRGGLFEGRLESLRLSTLVGLMTIGIATVSSAVVALGSAGYIQQFLDWPRGSDRHGGRSPARCRRGVGYSRIVVLASLFTLIEVGGLIEIIAIGVYSAFRSWLRSRMFPPWKPQRCPALRLVVCWPSSRSRDLRILPMWLTRPSSRAAVFLAQWF